VDSPVVPGFFFRNGFFFVKKNYDGKETKIGTIEQSTVVQWSRNVYIVTFLQFVMRLKFSKGKQKEIIDSLKKDSSWRQLSNLLGLSEGYLRNELKNEQRLLSDKTYRKICNILKTDFDKFIIEKLNENWGQSKGGTISTGKTKKVKLPEESEELSEFYGIMLGDGNLYRNSFYESPKNKRGVYSLRIVGDSRYDKSYLLNYVKPLIKKLFEIEITEGLFKPKGGKFKSKNAMFLVAYGIKVVDFLESKGFKPGNKIMNSLGIPKWIRKNKNFLRKCLRGLYDTDGGLYGLNSQKTYQVVFTNFNRVLLEDVRNSLLSLGIVSSKITKGNKIYVTKKSELRKFLKQIGFRNLRHSHKIEEWNLKAL